jgi:YD repeat-containing protein
MMHRTNRLCRRIPVVLFTIGIAVHAVFSQNRLDLFDSQGNHLMFVMFENDRDGSNIGRTVYMSDSTFVRHVGISRNAQGERIKETSFDFNDDTAYTASYSKSGESTNLSVRNQFGMDQFGGPVSYRASGTNDFIVSQRDADINKMTYEYDAQGNPTKITVSDVAGTMLYYGTFSEVGVIAPRNGARYTSPRIAMHGNGILTARFVLAKPAMVRCELMTLQGRRAGVLFNETFPRGAHRKNVRIASSASLRNADGMYLVILSIDGVVMSRSRQLIVRSGRSGS